MQTVQEVCMEPRRNTCSPRIRPGLHWYSYLYQLLVQVTNLAFDFPRQVGK